MINTNQLPPGYPQKPIRVRIDNVDHLYFNNPKKEKGKNKHSIGKSGYIHHVEPNGMVCSVHIYENGEMTYDVLMHVNELREEFACQIY